VLTRQAEARQVSYWPSIDGLRAVAILSVVAYHAGVPGVSGGYAGVDVFFVISGFLITSYLAHELNADGSLDIISFFARRVRRLIPALAVVVVSTLILGSVFLTPVGEQQDLARSAISTAAFVANFYFWRTQNGYFAASTDQLPLLHTWTLAVEEQFYIVWPLAMGAVALVARVRGVRLRSALLCVLVAGSLLSLALCVLVTPVRPGMAFYLTPFRIWEFGVGGLLALLRPERADLPPRVSGGLAAGGLAAIVAAVLTFDKQTEFPGFAAVLPVAGAAALIFGVVRAGICATGRFLASAPLVAIGRLSYSWYLWHWPLLALARASSLGERDPVRDGLLVLVALGLSALTYVLVEEPVRRRKFWPFIDGRGTIAAGLLLLGSMVALAGLSWHAGDRELHASAQLSEAYSAQTERFSYPALCGRLARQDGASFTVDDCAVGSETGPIAVLWGDSNAYHLIPAAHVFGESQGFRILPYWYGDCRPYTAAVPTGAPPGTAQFAASCVDFNRSVDVDLPALKALGAVAVMLAARWSGQGLYEPTLAEFKEELAARVAGLVQQGFKILLIADVPSFEASVPQCVARLGTQGCDRPREDVDRSRRKALGILNAIAAANEDVSLWDPIDEVCNAQVCQPVRDGRILVSDSQHLSIAGAERLSDPLGRVMGRLLEIKAASPRYVRGAD
jgi:peptidoglycan/LPS O-acetylase OafA/YrhL